MPQTRTFIDKSAMRETKKRSRDSMEEFLPHLLNGNSTKNVSRTSQPSRAINDIGLVTPPMLESYDLTPAAKIALNALYSESTVAKIWGIAQRALTRCTPPTLFPEYTKPGATAYVYREYDFWTSGFFPGCLYLLLQRQRKHPRFIPPSPYSGLPQIPHPLVLSHACKWWTVNLHQNARLTTTHDLGFMISPWARPAWELDHDPKAYETLITAAETLVARYNTQTRCLRSWDTCVTKRYSFLDPTLDFLVIIDNMLNLDLLFWAATELRSPRMREIAISHALTTREHHIRPDFSTYHVVNFDPDTGKPKQKMTNQGYSDSSCWSRGQAWAITGFAQTYGWTQDRNFLDTSKECADYFLRNLPDNGVPYWDFSAPVTPDTPTDTSAAVIACYGMLLLHSSLLALGEASPYLKAALHILTSVCTSHLSPPAHFLSSKIFVPSVEEHGESEESGDLKVEMGVEVETILGGATINNYEFAPRRWADHGLVYADYYFLMVGNLLLDMGIGGLVAEIGEEKV